MEYSISTILTKSLLGGKVHTLEIDEKYAKFSQDRVDEAGLSER